MTIALLLTLVLTSVSVDTTSTEEVRPPVRPTTWFVLPHAFYTPETGIAGGGAASFVFDAHLPRPTNIQAAVTITQRRQFIVEVYPDIFLDDGRVRVNMSAAAMRYPDLFFGVGGNTPGALEESYTATRFEADVEAVRTSARGVGFGVVARVRDESISDVSPDGILSSQVVAGSSGGWLAGVGPMFVADTRDNLFTASIGHYVRAFAIYHGATTTSSFNFLRLTLDPRRFVTLRGRHIAAAQVFVDATTSDAPFTLMPMVGGSRRLRGYHEGRFRDRISAVAQAEYRFPVLWRVGGAAFAAVGGVGHSISDFSTDHIRASIGGGLRFRLNESGVTARIDYAVGADGGALYLTLLEAF